MYTQLSGTDCQELGTECVPGATGGGARVGQGRAWREPLPLVLSAHVTRHSFSDKMVFVGFRGSFRPTWVTLATDDHQAKIFQVVPIPVVRKKRL